MSVHLKPIQQQVLFITGATSKIGLATIRLAVEKGAHVFMVGQDEDVLQNIQNEMRRKNFFTAYAVADLRETDQLQIATDHCLRTFGTIDTWINIAGDSIYGRLLETDEAQARKVFESNFWGVVNGCTVGIQLLKLSGGSMINIGGVIAPESLSIQGINSASLQAVKGYTDSLRKEVLAAKLPISVTLVQPKSSALPEAVASMILKAAEKSFRELNVKEPTQKVSWLERLFPKQLILRRKRVNAG